MGGADRCLLNILNEFPPSVQIYLVGANQTEKLLVDLDHPDSVSVINVGYHAYPYTEVERQAEAPTAEALRDYLDHFFDAHFKAFYTLTQALQGVQIDVVHSNASVVALGALYALYYGLKHIWHAREALVTDSQAQRFWVWLMNELSDAIIVPSQATVAGYGEKCQVIPDGFNPTDFLSMYQDLNPVDLAAEFQIQSDDTVLLSLGVVSKRKGQADLVRALDHLLADPAPAPRQNLRLFLVGYCPDTPYVQNLKQFVSDRKLDNVVKITGLLSYQHSMSLLKRADILVQPSPLPDPYPNVVIEAMLAGKPVIATRTGGIPEMIEDGQTGLLCQPEQPADLADKIKMLLDNPTLATLLGDCAGRLAPEKYHIKHTMTGLTQLYDKILSVSSPPPGHRAYWQTLLMAQIRQREARLLPLETTLQTREQQLATLQQALHATQITLQAREEDLDIIYSSKTWHVAKKMQQLYHLIKKPVVNLVRILRPGGLKSDEP